MADWNNPNPINTNPGGDTKYQGFVKAQSNFDDIYSKLNTVKKLQTGTTAPSNPAVGELWFDENTGILKRYDGTSWVEIAALPDLSNTSDITVLNKIKNVDGAGSGLDADTVDGKQASDLANVDLSNITALGNILNLDGSGSGLDADLVRGLPADFTNYLNIDGGYQKLPSGLILQWGRIAGITTTGAVVNITFPIAFPNAIAYLNCIYGYNYTTSAERNIYITTWSLTGASVDLGNATTQDYAYWFAIGY
ncbi:gp53-like domain-containing protein [Persephonella sp.]